ncbi:DUF3800 domain-containing protein [Curtobacterium sp. 458]|uniref:DUF3800 domain-containing protein n=1 Tax=Curtobacterium sp. 458 TaxID=3050069 RepID=UPI0025B477D7|nr:DUF3800 domain-containing protein [Curtobacterium sp. 458]WJY00797.1 DUF3800 domain-containing protein [Curtobacterium sp. 458]
MLIAYVDESYDRDAYFIGAAIATFDEWETLSSRLSAVRHRTAREHGTAHDIEFHGHELMGGTGPWAALRGRHREAAGISFAALSAARESGVRYIFRGLDVARLKARFRYPKPPHAIVFAHLLEQINHYVGMHDPDEQAIIVADEITTQAEHQRAFTGYQAFGTSGEHPSRLTHLSAPINFATSRLSDGLQVVDLALYVHYRRERVRSRHEAARRTLRRQWDLVEPVVVHRQTWVP